MYVNIMDVFDIDTDADISAIFTTYRYRLHLFTDTPLHSERARYLRYTYIS